MQLTENKIFLAIFVGIIFFGLLVYATEYMKEKTTTTTSRTTSSTSSPSSSSSSMPTTTTSETTSSSSSSSSSTTTTSSSSSSSLMTTTSSSTTTSTSLNYYWAKYAGKGYRQLFLDIHFTCPSCVPATARALSLQQGVVMQNIGFRQAAMWVIYDPNKTTQYDVMRAVRSEGDAAVLNDILIP